MLSYLAFLFFWLSTYLQRSLKNNRARSVIFLTIWLNAVALGLVFPILPRLPATVMRTADISLYIGIMAALYALMQLVFAPALWVAECHVWRGFYYRRVIGGVPGDYGLRLPFYVAAATRFLDERGALLTDIVCSCAA